MSTTATIRIPADRAASARTARAWAYRIGVIVIVLIGWESFALTPLAHAGSVPTPVQAFGRLGVLLGTGTFWAAIGNTMLSWSLGMLLSFFVGVPLGLAIGSVKWLEKSTRLAVDFLRTIPAIAFIPVALLAFGADQRTSVLIIFLGAVWPLLVQSTYAALEIDPALGYVRRSFHLTSWQYVWYQFLPSALPFITTGLRIAATVCLLTAVSVQFLSGSPGIGAELNKAQIVSAWDSVYAYVLVSGVLGILINLALLWLQRAVIWWHPSVRGDSR